MRCSSGNVSWPTSMMGGWYVCIMDMGREERPVSERWRCWAGLGEVRSLLRSFSAVADSANECEDGGGFEGDWAVVGDAGPGEGAADVDVVVLCWLLAPPHCDMKERTVRERTERSISECSYTDWTGASCLVKQPAEGRSAQPFTSLRASHDGRSFFREPGSSS